MGGVVKSFDAISASIRSASKEFRCSAVSGVIVEFSTLAIVAAASGDGIKIDGVAGGTI